MIEGYIANMVKSFPNLGLFGIQCSWDQGVFDAELVIISTLVDSQFRGN